MRGLPGRRGRRSWAGMLGAAVCLLCTACSPPPPPPPPPQGDIGYVDWIVRQAWAIDDLPSVTASYDELCRRAEQGDEQARTLAETTGPALWLVRIVVLPVLGVLPGAEDLPPEERLVGRCPTVPDAALASAAQDFLAGTDRAHGAERLVAIEYQGGTAGIADDARLARAVLSVTLLFPLDELGPTPALAQAIASLDPDGELLALPDRASAACAALPTDPPCLWERLAAQALRDAGGTEALDRTELTPEALDTLARRGLLNLVARVLLPVTEDASSTLPVLAAEFVVRLGRALGFEPAQDGGGEGTTGQDWPEAAP